MSDQQPSKTPQAPQPPQSSAGTVRMVDSSSGGASRILLVLTGLLVLLFLVTTIFFWNRSSAGEDLLDDQDGTITSLQVERDECLAKVEDCEGGDEDEEGDDELREILIHTFDGPGSGYAGVAELEGYVMAVERTIGIGGGDPISCNAFYVTDGPEEAMAHIDIRSTRHDGDPLIILGEAGDEVESAWFNTEDIANSSASDPVLAVFRLGSRFEGELVGCMEDIEFIGTSESPAGFIGG
jgi:preprotein translocase subunit SecG